jgi:hypothetical protein
MVVIEECCKCIDDGTYIFGSEMAEMHVRGRNEVTNYYEIKYCPFSGKPIRIRSEISPN